MKAIIASVHRSGSNYLASVLDGAIEGVKVSGEDRAFLPKYAGGEEGYKAHVQKYIDNAPDEFVHISPQFTHISKDIEADKLAFLIRNPYDHALSKVNFNPEWKDKLLDSLISDIELFYGYIAKGRNKIFKYESLDKKGILSVCKWLGLDADLSKVNLDKAVNRRQGNYKSLDEAITDKKRLSELMVLIKKYQKRFKY